MLTRRRRLLSHATLALGMGVLSWLLIRLSSGGLAGLLLVAAAIASILVATGFVVRFVTVLSSEPNPMVPVDPNASSRTTSLHWTERGLMAWTGLCIAALTAEAVGGFLGDPQRAILALAILFIVGLIAMQAVRLVRVERGVPASSGTR